jgi:Na+-driven multidrug efflux pump
MTEAPRRPATLLRLAAPLMVSFTLRSLLTAVDLPYGALLGDAAVAAMGLAFPLEFVFLACWIGLSGAMTSHLSRAMGARREERMAAIVRATTRLVVTVSALFLALAAAVWAVTPHLGLDAEVAANFRIYAPILVAGAALAGFWSVIPDSIVKAHHDTRSTMIAGLISGGLNLVLNTVFLLLGWGIFGLALATFLGRTGGLAYNLWRARTLEAERRRAWSAEPSTPDPEPLARPYRALLALAVPTALAYVLMACEGVIGNAALAGYPSSKPSLAAFAIFHRTSSLLLMPVAGTAVAMLPFVARALGEGRGAEVRGAVQQALRVAVA